MSHRIAVFVGTRPEAIKMAPVVRALEHTHGLEPVVVSTGQHREMLQQALDLFGLPVHHTLDVMVKDQTLAGLSARLVERTDAFLRTESPDFALVQGDTTTVLMAALACFYRKTPIGHVEAGLRTGNVQSPFPEEANRKLVTPLAELHFPPTDWSRQNLLDEGVPAEDIVVTGNTVIDALHIEIECQRQGDVMAEVDAVLAPSLGTDWRESNYVLVTGHRRENFGGGLDEICRALRTLAERFRDHRFVYPVHPNPNILTPVREKLGDLPNVVLLAPQPYRQFVALMQHARLVLTDSGGVQEEAPSLGKPVLVMRETTERPEGVEAGTVRLVGASEPSIVESVHELLTDEDAYRRMAEARNPYGDGRAAMRISAALLERFGGEPMPPSPGTRPVNVAPAANGELERWQP